MKGKKQLKKLIEVRIFIGLFIDAKEISESFQRLKVKREDTIMTNTVVLDDSPVK